MKRALLFGVLSLGLLSVPAVANDHRDNRDRDSYRRDEHHTVYRVLYTSGHDWHVYASYESYSAAEHAADGLRHRGYQVRVERN